jgi:ABC-type Zn uptake system ZnuABC Zn-binding protein ZnuA
LLDRAGNRKIMEGSPGYVSAHDGIALLEVPSSVSRAGGDVHADGNPHLHTDPINGIIIGRNILAGLIRIDPASADYYRARASEFERRILEGIIGKPLVEVLTPATAFNLLQTNEFDGFIARTNLHGKPLAQQLGGWLKAGSDFRGKEIACYHKEWSYFSVRFHVTCVAYVEAKPGLPPTPKHVEELVALMKARQIPAIFASNYYPKSQVEQVAAKTGAKAVIVAENTLGAPGITTYYDLVNQWVADLAAAFRQEG